MLLTAAIAVFGFIVNAQTEKGQWVIGGNSSISFTSTKTNFEFDGEEVGDEIDSSIFTVTPSVGYFVMDNLSVGMDVGLQFTKSGDVKTSTTSLIPNAVYYFDGGDKLKPFVGLGVGLASLSQGDEDEQKFSGLLLRGTGGLAYFINDSISLNFVVQYINTNQKNKANEDIVSKNNNIGAGLGIWFFL